MALPKQTTRESGDVEVDGDRFGGHAAKLLYAPSEATTTTATAW
jgi:hypothetical protein